MNEFNENDIGKLLRLKRHEQPPPGYFDNFLEEFHRRQRVEMLRQSPWQVGWQRVQDFVSEMRVPSLMSYPAAATALLVCAAVLSFKVSQAPSGDEVGSQLAAIEQQSAPVVARVTGDSAWSLSTPVSARSFEDAGAFPTTFQSAPTRQTAVPPRYVLDSTPVSYEASLRF